MVEESHHFLDARFRSTLEREGRLLDELTRIARTMEPEGREDRDATMLRAHLDEPFLLVVVGEVKSGKSSFINALLGEDVCAEGPTPLTDKIHVLRHGETAERKLLEPFLQEHQLPIDLLKEVHIVDTPGTNSILREHSTVTERFLPRADLVLFLTSIDRPYSESENQFLGLISDHWRKKVVFLVTKIDGREPGDVELVRQFVRRSCLEHHHFEPQVLALSARLSKEGQDGGLEQVRELIRATLSGAEKTRLKLLSPLRSAVAVMGTLEKKIEDREALLTRDYRAVQELDQHVQNSAKDLKERTYQFVTEVYEHFAATQGRARAFFDKTIRLRNISRYRNEDRLKTAFHAEVIGELESDFLATMNRAVDWLTRESIGLHERATESLLERIQPQIEQAQHLPRESSRFEYRREKVIESIHDSYDRQARSMDLTGETGRLMQEMQRGMTRQVGVSVAAVLVGAGSVAFLPVLWASIGVFAAIGVGIGGFAFLPVVRRRALRRFQERAEQLAIEVRDGFLQVFHTEIDGTCERLRRGWEQFVAFYRAETEAIRELRLRLREIQREAAELDEWLNTAVKPTPGPSAANLDRSPEANRGDSG